MDVVLDQTLAADSATDPTIAAGHQGTSDVLERGALVGRYVVLARLGAGGMGIVYAAYDPKLDRKIALKVLRPGAHKEPERNTRLLREAQAMAKIRHPNVVAVHDVGVLNDQLFVAMEFVDGAPLSAWLRERPHPWREVIDLFRAVGRGLSAAHALGVIHRDLKPDNIMVDREGRPRVMDFGLARANDNECGETLVEPWVQPHDQMLRVSLTQTGALLGTPAYMAPEQWAGLKLDPRADQFSFSVTLWEALFGERPFHGESVPAIALAVLKGEIAARDQGTATVPARIRRVVERGLAVDPQLRWPSMDAMLAALSSDPSIPRRWWSAVAVAALLGGWSAWTLTRPETLVAREDPCANVGALGATWDDSSKAAVRMAIEATALPFASDTWVRVQKGLNSYSSAWSEMRTEACHANKMGLQSDMLYDHRVQCLERRRHDLGALVQVLAAANGTVVEQAVNATHALPSIEDCADAQALLTPVTLPDPTIAGEVERLRVALAAPRAELAAGRFKEAWDKLASLATDAEQLAYRPLLGELQYVRGQVAMKLGDYKAARSDFEAATWAAEATRHDELAVDAAMWMIELVERPEEVRVWEQIAEAAHIRRGGPGEREGRWFMCRAHAAHRAGDFDRALELLSQNLTAVSRQSYDNPYEIASLLNSLGAVYGSRGDNGDIEQALQYFERALPMLEEQLGPKHPDVATILANLGNVTMTRGDAETARRLYARSLAIYESAYGSEHPAVALVAFNLAGLNMRHNEYSEAETRYLKVLAIRRKHLGAAHTDTANVLAVLGALYVKQGQPKRALEPLQEALTSYEATVGNEHYRYLDVLVQIGLAEFALGQAHTGIEKLEQALSGMLVKPGPRANIGEARFGLARALWSERRQRTRALELARAAIEDFRSAGIAYNPERMDAEAWLVTHSR